jgi:hypothetical protein
MNPDFVWKDDINLFFFKTTKGANKLRKLPSHWENASMAKRRKQAQGIYSNFY